MATFIALINFTQQGLTGIKDTAKRADRLQLMGELILAYGPNSAPGSTRLAAEDYEGKPIEISLDPELTFLENANRFFEKAKRAKSRATFVHDQLARLVGERNEVCTRRIEWIEEHTSFPS